MIPLSLKMSSASVPTDVPYRGFAPESHWGPYFVESKNPQFILCTFPFARFDNKSIASLKCGRTHISCSVVCADGIQNRLLAVMFVLVLDDAVLVIEQKSL